MGDALTEEIRRLADGVHALRLVRRLIVERHKMKFPLLESLPTALDKHNHLLEARARRTHERLHKQDARAGQVDGRLNAHLDSVDSTLDANDQYLDKIEAAIGDNGDPTSGEAMQTSPGGSAWQGVIQDQGQAAQGVMPKGEPLPARTVVDANEVRRLNTP